MNTLVDKRRRLLVVHGGSELYGSDLMCLKVAAAAADAGWDVDALVPARGPLAGLLEAAGVTVHIADPLVLRRADLRTVRPIALARQWITALRRLRAFSKQHSYEIVHSNTAPTIGGAYLARRWAVPHVWHVHEILWQPRLVTAVFERLLFRADAIVCASTAVVQQFRSASLRARCRVAHSSPMVPTDIATTEPLVHDRCSIISVGRLNDGKGQGILIKALAVLRQHDFPVRLVLVGGVFPGQEHFRDELVRLANRLGVADAIEFAGERRDALQLVGRSDIFVMPSTRPESFGMALVEAMHLRRPVIATDIGGPREIIHHGRDGLLVPPGDPDALARAIRWLIENPEAARALAAAAQERAADFRETDLTETVLGLYEQFVPQAPSGSGREMSEAPWDDFPRLARTAVSET